MTHYQHDSMLRSRPGAAALILLLTGVFAVPLVAQVSATEADDVWNQWRGPRRDGSWHGDLPGSLSNLALVWERMLQPSYSGPVTDGKNVYTTETVDEAYEQVSAFDLETGEPTWTSRWEGAIEVPPYAAANGSWIKSTPVLGEGSIVILGMRDELLCLNQHTGEQCWRVDLADRYQSRRPPFGGVCSPLIDDGSVYLMAGGGTLRLRLSDGESVWRTLADEGEDDDALSSPIIAEFADVRQLVVQTRTRLCGVDLLDGTVLWQKSIKAYRNMNILTPTVIGDRIFTAAHSGRAQCFVVRFRNGRWTVEEAWSRNVQAYMSSPVADRQTIYLHSKNERLTAIDVESGEIRWTSQPMGSYHSLVQNDDILLGLSSRGGLVSARKDPGELVVLSRTQVANDSWAHLGVFDGGLLVRDLHSLKVFRY